MRFLLDAQLPPALARMMTDLGYQAEHVLDVGLLESDDNEIWDFAIAHQSIIITKDEDFPSRTRRSKICPVIVWLRIRNTSRRALLEWFQPLLPKIVEFIQSGERLIEVR